MASIKDVAKYAGVSISTVSNVLNETKYVSDELVKKVSDAVQTLNYEADPIARNMKNKKSKTIGVITVDMCGLFYPYVVKGIYEKINQEGYNILICDLSVLDASKNSLERELEIFKRLTANRVDGIIFASTVSEQKEELFIKQIQKMANAYKKIPLVAIEKDFSKYGIDSVFSDHVEGGYMATRHLIQCGCKNIAHITGPIFSNGAIDRLEGYKKALLEEERAVEAETMVANGNYTHQSGYIATNELLKKYPSMDGIFIANDQMAVGALKALAENNKCIPEDIKVIGYDNVFISSILEPSLSSVHVRKGHFGREAARILFERLEELDRNSGMKEDVVAMKLDSRVVVRKSTSNDVADDWILSDW